MTEQIGNITLDDTHYPGEDLYCDGIVEDELLDIVRNYPPEDYGRMIEERTSWPVFYHLSPLRENIVSWLPLDKSMKVLEVGSGCGAVTGAFSKMAGEVTCIDLSMKRSHINAYRHKEKENITIHVGNFKDIEPDLPSDYDYIFLIGVFEYGQGYMGTDNPYGDFLAILKKHLKAGGRLAIAIENRLGLKYFAGCKEDHLGNYFSGIEDYPEGGGVRTFSKSGLEGILRGNGMEEYEFYYPYPDYKFMSQIYSDSYLPKVGELSTNIRNFDRDRMLLFDEKNAFDGIIKDGEFPMFSNSYFVLTGPPVEVKYSKFSNDRSEEYAIRTDICAEKQGEFYVVKMPLGAKAAGHIDNIKTSYRLLKKRYEGGRLELNQCEDWGEGLRFEYIEGSTLEELFDYLLDKQDHEGFIKLFKEYVEAIDYNNSVKVSDFDLIFSNILMKDGQWTVIDYEWTFGKEIPTGELAYRAFYCYTMGAEKRRKLNQDLILRCIGLTTEEAANIRLAEKKFQASVTGRRLPMAAMRDKINYKVMNPQIWEAEHKQKENRERVQIYEDLGNGFREQDSYFVKGAFYTSDKIDFRIVLSDKVSRVRIDPAMETCIVYVEKIVYNGVEMPLKGKKISVNGVRMGEGTFCFLTEDPNIAIDLSGLVRTAHNVLEAVMYLGRVAPEIANSFQSPSFWKK